MSTLYKCKTSTSNQHFSENVVWKSFDLTCLRDKGMRIDLKLLSSQWASSMSCLVIYDWMSCQVPCALDGRQILRSLYVSRNVIGGEFSPFHLLTRFNVAFFIWIKTVKPLGTTLKTTATLQIWWSTFTSPSWKIQILADVLNCKTMIRQMLFLSMVRLLGPR